MSARDLQWFKSSHSGSAGDNCVEVALTRRVVHVRDSKDFGVAPLTLSHTAWRAFTAYARTDGAGQAA
ncbi:MULTISPECIES: DUF397 domain-containing protein [Streptomyces]|uniref:DUF397 domain-containing protein n=2 Tax=Streptomyces TaxID=1883 RepID=A0A100Y6P8_9ACTN|nr:MULTISPECIES: DUF397 domain-containing protein [Streptomyces]KUH38655.1 hypothetical protein ATE80_11635 [Streptomyces kanasensis]UUS31156.1 DUF397 domain-containing protein [Streptomyces changanensis]